MTAQAEQEPICCETCDDAKKVKYYSIANDSGPWLCGETCIRNFFYPIFHIFEKNLTKSTWTNSPCKDAGYTVYQETVTHGGGGLYCTLDLYACNSTEGCPHAGDDKRKNATQSSTSEESTRNVVNSDTQLRGSSDISSRNDVVVCTYDSEGSTGTQVCVTHTSGECFSVPNAYRTTSSIVTCDSNDDESDWTRGVSPYDFGCRNILFTAQGSGTECTDGVTVHCAGQRPEARGVAADVA